KMQFFKKDKTALIQLGIDLLVINHLKPYPTWKSYKPLILDNLNKYNDLAKPKGLKRIGLRYINKIDISEISANMADYFNYYPNLPKDLPQVHESFNTQIGIPYEQNRDMMFLNFNSILTDKQDAISFLLDLDYSMRMPGKVNFNEIDDWLEKAHNVIENTFESCITNKLRTLFGEVE
ncbi:MAG: TIGR04255 family protein, partial [Candidatus Firestonebacteria bacterium]|nr:TIGR04255 family protein [Candidatus Firestonebacteria bacterium]